MWRHHAAPQLAQRLFPDLRILGNTAQIAFLERQTSSLYAVAVTRDAVAIDQSAMGCRIVRLEGLDGLEGWTGRRGGMGRRGWMGGAAGWAGAGPGLNACIARVDRTAVSTARNTNADGLIFMRLPTKS